MCIYTYDEINESELLLNFRNYNQMLTWHAQVSERLRQASKIITIKNVSHNDSLASHPCKKAFLYNRTFHSSHLTLLPTQPFQHPSSKNPNPQPCPFWGKPAQFSLILIRNASSLANITVQTSQWERVQWTAEQMCRGTQKCQSCSGPSFQCLWIKHTDFQRLVELKLVFQLVY